MITKQYLYAHIPQFPGMIGLPLLPVTFAYQTRSVSSLAIVDSGSTVNVLPYDVGLELGLIWEKQTFPLHLTGMLAGAPAFGVVVTGQIEGFPPVPLACAWTRRNDVRLLLGQTNFFQRFQIAFDGRHGIFTLRLNPE